MANIDGYYVNLDKATDRRAYLDAKLNQLGLEKQIKRFAALQGDSRPSHITKGELGCFLSHQNILNNAANNAYTLILEDDIILTSMFAKYLNTFIDNIGGNYDILFFNGGVEFRDIHRLSLLIKFKNELGDIYNDNFSNFKLLDATQWYLHGTSAYIVNPLSKNKIVNLMNDEEKNGFTRPIDLFYNQSIRENKITAAVFFPFLTGINWDFPSQMGQERASTSASFYYDFIVNLFVAGGDISALKLSAYEILHSSPLNCDAFIVSQLIYKKLAADV